MTTWIERLMGAAGNQPVARHYLRAVMVVFAAAVVSYPARRAFDPTNLVMVFLLAVVFVGMREGRGPSVLASVLAVVVFDFFFVPPQLSFAVSDVQYLLTFAVMLAVGLVVGQLTAGLRNQALLASQRHARSMRLYEFASALAGAVSLEHIADVTVRFVKADIGAKADLFVRGLHDTLERTVVEGASQEPPTGDIETAKKVLEASDLANGPGRLTLFDNLVYVPLRASASTRGVMAVEFERPTAPSGAEPLSQLELLAPLIAIALERVHYVQVAQAATLRMESEQLRNALLAAVSHDLRTPLTGLLGWAEMLELAQPPLPTAQREVATAIATEAHRMSRLVSNMLEMARLQVSNVEPRRQWESVEEMVGGAIRSASVALSGASVSVAMPADMPLVRCDGVLVERVLTNLLENAAKYGGRVLSATDSKATESTAGSSEILVEARVEGDEALIEVKDRGPGVPEGQDGRTERDALFEKFKRGSVESSVPGLGLGLSICRTVVLAHGGRIWARNREGGGAVFGFSLPLEPGPVMSGEPQYEQPSHPADNHAGGPPTAPSMS
jgi:two-component system sensor histidine kinase KdpD